MADVVFEVCSCGAEFRWAGSAHYASIRVKEWRKDHIHDMSAAIARAQASGKKSEKPELTVKVDPYPRSSGGL